MTPAPIRRDGRARQGGFTLIETLVSIGLAAVVLGGLATAVRSQSRSAIFQMGTADVSQDVRSALEMFKRDVRMAGLGLGAVPPATLAPVLVGPLSAGQLYRVRLRGNYSNVISRGGGSVGTITLDATAAPYPTFTAGRRVTIESPIFAIAEVRTIVSWNAGTHIITVTPNLTSVYAAGSPVRQIEEIDYILDNQGVLRRNGDPVADQLTGALQVQYVLADGTSVADPAAALDNLRAASIRLRAAGTTTDGLTPQADISTQVRIRNLAITGIVEEEP